MSSNPISRGTLLALLVLFTAVWFGTLEYRKLIKPDEGRYAEIAREMAVTGDFVTPRLNGIKYFEKPPLQYWATATAFRTFGENEWTARLWSGLTGFAGVLLAYFAGRRFFGSTAGALAATVLGTSFLYVFIGHLNTLDMALCFFLQLTVCAFMFGQAAPPGSRSERNWMLVAWAAMALALLSKGLVGIVLPGATLFVYSVVQRDLSPWKRMHFGLGLPLFLILAAPWFVAVTLANPEFPRFFFIYEHFERFLSKTEHRRYQPAWYFIPILLGGLLPWTTLALQALATAWTRPEPGHFNVRRFLLLWTAVVFLFFSASGSKLPSYILPVFPAVALLTGDALTRMRARTLRWHLGLVAVIAIVALGMLSRVGGMGDNETPNAMMQRYAVWLMIAAGVFALGTLIALWWNHKGRPLGALLILGCAALFLAETSLQGHESLGRSNSSHYIAQQVRPLVEPDTPFYSVKMYEQTLPFYLQRTLTLVDYQDEMGFGLRQEPKLWVPTVEEFKTRWRTGPYSLAMMNDDTYKQLQAEGLPMRVVARDTRRVFVQNKP